MPPPSEPSTSATRSPRSSAASVRSAVSSSPQHPEAGVLQPVERAREIDDADQRHAFERARGGLGERSRRRAARRARRQPPRARQRRLAERSTAPTLCGSLTWSSTTMIERPSRHPGARAAHRRDRARSSGSTSSASPDEPHPRAGAPRSRRGRARCIGSPVAASWRCCGGDQSRASFSCPASTASRRQRRSGLASAAATAWRP